MLEPWLHEGCRVSAITVEMEVLIGRLQSRQLTGTRTNAVASYQWEVCVFFLGGYFIPTQNNKGEKKKSLQR
jgi:hypothetical protein